VTPAPFEVGDRSLIGPTRRRPRIMGLQTITPPQSCPARDRAHQEWPPQGLLIRQPGNPPILAPTRDHHHDSLPDRMGSAPPAARRADERLVVVESRATMLDEPGAVRDAASQTEARERDPPLQPFDGRRQRPPVLAA